MKRYKGTALSVKRGLTVCTTAILLVALVGGAGWWAGRATLAAPEDPFNSTPIPTYEVVAGRVGRTQNVFVNASWTMTEVAHNQLLGIVTSVDHPGEEAKAGQVLYRVNLDPVVVAVGDVPAFRDMTTGTTGPDIAQLQHLFGTLGLYRGKADGKFDTGVADAVKRWQRSMQSEETGTVKLGQVLFIPRLPARLLLGPQVTVGTLLHGGEIAAQQVSDAPTFVVPLLAEQQRFAVVGIDVVIRTKDSDLEWKGTVANANPGDDGGFELQIAGLDGKPPCADGCEAVPLTEPTLLPGELILVPPLDGPVVPIGAVLTSPEGDAHVVMADGSQRSVTILASSDGLAVVDGLTVGDVIRLGRAVEGVPQ